MEDKRRLQRGFHSAFATTHRALIIAEERSKTNARFCGLHGGNHEGLKIEKSKSVEMARMGCGGGVQNADYRSDAYAKRANVTRGWYDLLTHMSNPKLLDNPVKRRFQSLVAAWKSATSSSVSSSLSEMFGHPAYRQIIAMGAPAVPLLLAELEREPDWWFAALREMTGADPVPAVGQGKLAEQTRAWLQWGRAQGYRW